MTPSEIDQWRATGRGEVEVYAARDLPAVNTVTKLPFTIFAGSRVSIGSDDENGDGYRVWFHRRDILVGTVLAVAVPPDALTVVPPERREGAAAAARRRLAEQRAKEAP